MKKIGLVVLSCLLFALSCSKDYLSEHYTFFRPVYMTKAQVRAGIKSGPAQSVLNTGKLLVRGNLIYLNDIDRGIHIIDNTNPAQPKPIAFIAIPGCVDLALNNNYLYADCYTDMVTLDITDPLNVSVKQFIYGVFPNRNYGSFIPDTSLVIQKWIRIDTVVTNKFSGNLSTSPAFLVANFLGSGGSGTYYTFASTSSTGAGIGISGSMSRFAQMNQRLYTVYDGILKVFGTVNPDAPVYKGAVSLPNGIIETIFPSGNQLFIGSQTGMFVYDAKNPDQPQLLCQFSHAKACDPVITDGSYAYVTLRSNGTCGGLLNELDIIDITSITTPSLIRTYSLKAPAGLSKDGNLLFICDGTDGLKVFNAANANGAFLVKQIAGFEAYDVVAFNGTAIVVAKDGLYMVDYSDIQNIQLVGKLSIAKAS